MMKGWMNGRGWRRTQVFDIPDFGRFGWGALMRLLDFLLGGFGGFVVYRQASDGRVDLGERHRHDG
jgi:hypothetical protein